MKGFGGFTKRISCNYAIYPDIILIDIISAFSRGTWYK